MNEREVDVVIPVPIQVLTAFRVRRLFAKTLSLSVFVVILRLVLGSRSPVALVY